MNSLVTMEADVHTWEGGEELRREKRVSMLDTGREPLNSDSNTKMVEAKVGDHKRRDRIRANEMLLLFATHLEM